MWWLKFHIHIHGTNSFFPHIYAMHRKYASTAGGGTVEQFSVQYLCLHDKYCFSFFRWVFHSCNSELDFRLQTFLGSVCSHHSRKASNAMCTYNFGTQRRIKGAINDQSTLLFLTLSSRLDFFSICKQYTGIELHTETKSLFVNLALSFSLTLFPD